MLSLNLNLLESKLEVVLGREIFEPCLIFYCFAFFNEKPHTNWKFEHILHRRNKWNCLDICIQIHKINLVKCRGESYSKSCDPLLAVYSHGCFYLQQCTKNLWYASHLLFLLFWNKIDFAFLCEMACIYICWCLSAAV